MRIGERVMAMILRLKGNRLRERDIEMIDADRAVRTGAALDRLDRLERIVADLRMQVLDDTAATIARQCPQ